MRRLVAGGARWIRRGTPEFVAMSLVGLLLATAGADARPGQPGTRSIAARRNAAEVGRREGEGRGSAGARRPATRREPRFPPVVLYHVNHRETMLYRPYDAKGRWRKSELSRFNRFMRDGSGRRGRIGRMHPRLAALFYQVARHYARQGKRVEVISGYRPDARNPRSPHRKGLAVDFRVRGVPNAALRDYLRSTFQRVGVGYYPNSVFVHFDVRQKSAFWIDYSGPGEEPIYSEDPIADLKSGRAETYKPRKREPGESDDARAGAGEDAPPPGQEAEAPPEEAEPPPAGDEEKATDGGGEGSAVRVPGRQRGKRGAAASQGERTRPAPDGGAR